MFQKLRNDLRKKLSEIKLLLINADGFLTESQPPYYAPNPGFDNGHEVRALKRLGVHSVAFSTRRSEAVRLIAEKLGIEELYQDVSNRLSLYSKVKLQHSVSDGEIAFIGGDFSDLSMIEKVNFPVAPADAPLEVKAKSYYVTYGTGEDAVGEVADLILKAKNHSGKPPKFV